MKLIFLVFLLVLPSRDVDIVQLELNSPHISIFKDYENGNFVQKVNSRGKSVHITLENSDFLNLNLNHRVIIDNTYISGIKKDVKNLVSKLHENNITLKTYLSNISFFLKDNIKYWENSPFKKADEVIIFKRANCIGFSSLVRELLNSAGIRNRYIKGFYLDPVDKGIFNPIPHKWLELYLPSGASFFYDPQYQGFTANYIVLDNDIDFKTIRKFKVKIVSKRRKLIN
ncbi:MAG: transglutaminase-like domain-containing protein [Acidobacteriota bacterium]